MSDDPIVDLSSLLSIIKSNEAERTYVLKVKDSENDSSDNGDIDTVALAYEPVDYLMTGVLNGNEKYIRYCKGEVVVIGEGGMEVKVVWPKPVSNKVNSEIKNLRGEVCRYLRSQNKPL